MRSDTKEWLEIAQEDYDDSLYLFKAARHPNAVYHMCQAVEKILKAAQVEFARTAPKKTHELEKVADKTTIAFSEKQRQILKSLSKHYRRVRYPDIQRSHYNTKAKVEEIMADGKKIYLWIRKKLRHN